MPLRIALVSREYPTGLFSGGIGTYTQKTARALAGLGQEVHVFIEGNSEIAVAVPGEPIVHRLPEVNARPDENRAVQRAWTVARALRERGPFDVVQACEWDAEAVFYAIRPQAPLITRLATPTYVVNKLNGATTRKKLRTATLGRLERLQTRLSHRVISPSRALADLITDTWRLRPERVRIVPTGIEIPAEPAGPPLHGFANRKYVLYFGRLETRKGVKTWIDALPTVLAADEDLWAVFAGQDIGMPGITFEEYATRQLGPLMQRVAFFPRLPHSELFPLVAGASLVVIPSIWESLANTCLESMALGRPVVATTGSGLAELIHDGVDGILVEPESSQQLASSVSQALAEPERLRQIGKAARSRARDFDLEKMASTLLGLYEDLVPSPRTQPTVIGVHSIKS